MKKTYGYLALLTVTAMVFSTALAHLSCIYFGPSCYAAQMAPKAIIESAQSGTLLAPIGAIIVSALFITIGLYSLSAAKIINNLPLEKLAIYVISNLCIIRGILGIQLAIRQPERMDCIATTASVVWLFAGLLLLSGYKVIGHYFADNAQLAHERGK